MSQWLACVSQNLSIAQARGVPFVVPALLFRWVTGAARSRSLPFNKITRRAREFVGCAVCKVRPPLLRPRGQHAAMLLSRSRDGGGWSWRGRSPQPVVPCGGASVGIDYFLHLATSLVRTRSVAMDLRDGVRGAEIDLSIMGIPRSDG